MQIQVTKSHLINRENADISLLLDLEAYILAVLWIQIRIDFGRLDPDPRGQIHNIRNPLKKG
jgi:hypothetical protein